ncbi:MAG: hypothetical protein Q8916_00810 [Bacteroidota bacterium]|nr:hypothetical protein [Bacteroidota bacterium]MDP4228926.1 hypothetical protein [Bacteroidota bacterium]MDP4236404.1 hypothetical protein [Bacteroidota bacterium]
MKLTSLIALAFLLSAAGCAKHEDDPSAVVLSYYKAATGGDSAGYINSFSSTIREQMLTATDSTKTVKFQLQYWKGSQADVKIREVHIDSLTPHLAKVYYSAKVTGKDPFAMDSVFLIVSKEDDGWKISSSNPQRDRH